MKITKSILAALMLAGIGTQNPLTMAEDKPDAAKPNPPRPERRAQAVDRLQQIAKELDLSEDQKAKIKTVLQQEAEKRKALREDTSLSQEQRREKTRGLREEFTGKMKEVLTTEQFEKWQKLRQAQGNRPPRRDQKPDQKPK